MTQAPAAPPRPALRFAEFVTLIAALMALTALSIDVMLPALPQTRADRSGCSTQPPAARPHQLRDGFAIGQLFHGPLSDWLAAKARPPAGLAMSMPSPPSPA